MYSDLTRSRTAAEADASTAELLTIACASASIPFRSRELSGRKRRLQTLVLLVAEAWRHQNQPLHIVRIIEGEVDGDAGAEGEPDDERGADVQLREQRVKVVAVRERSVGPRGSTDTANVVGNNRVAMSEGGHLLAPHAAIEGRAAADEDDGGPTAANIVSEGATVDRRDHSRFIAHRNPPKAIRRFR
jgi:hypothetical protein